MCFSLLRVSLKGTNTPKTIEAKDEANENELIEQELSREGVSKVEVFRAHHHVGKREIREVVVYKQNKTLELNPIVFEVPEPAVQS